MAGVAPDPAAEARALLGAGRRQEAARILSDALELDPAHPELLTLRAQLALQQGDLESARRDLESARVTAPDEPVVLHALAGVCHAQGDDAAAESHLQRALTRDPTQARLWYSLGLVRHAAGRYRVALDAYDRALTQTPTLVPALVGRGKIWQIQGDLDAAEKAFRDVLATHPNHPEATAALAAQMLIRGDFEEGLRLIDGLATRQALDTELSLVRARLLRGAGRPAEALAFLQSLDTDRMTAADRRHLEYALGELHDRLGEHTAAFRHYVQANRRKPGRFDGARHRRRMAAIRDVWSRAALDDRRGLGDPSASPVFVIGMPRSGTSLVEQILSAHPDLYAAGELTLIGDLASDWRGGSEILRPDALRSESLRPAAASYLAAANPGGSLRFTDKMPANFEHLGLIQLMLPDARVVHCRRHPLDTALSCYFQDFSALGLAWSNRLEDIATYYGCYRELMNHWHEVISMPILDLDYERLVTEPAAQIRMLLDFVDLAWHPDCLAHHDSDRVVATASHDQARRPIYREAIGRHRAYADYLAPLAPLMEEKDGV